MISRAEARILWEHYCQMVEKLMDAKIKLLDGGVKSYTIDGRSLTRFDLDTLDKMLLDAIKKRGEFEAIMNGARSRKAVGVIPRDF